MLTVLTQKPRFSTGNLRLLVLAAAQEETARLPFKKWVTAVSPGSGPCQLGPFVGISSGLSFVLCRPVPPCATELGSKMVANRSVAVLL
jgi:hypothetical protein